MKIHAAYKMPGRPEDVFPWIEYPEKAMLWQQGVSRAEIIRETPGKIGTTFIEEMSEDGKSLQMRGSITAYEENHSIAFHLESHIHELDVSYTVADANGASVITVDSDIHWRFPMALASLFMGRRMKESILAQMEAEFMQLRKLCEHEQRQSTD